MGAYSLNTQQTFSAPQDKLYPFAPVLSRGSGGFFPAELGFFAMRVCGQVCSGVLTAVLGFCAQHRLCVSVGQGERVMGQTRDVMGQICSDEGQIGNPDRGQSHDLEIRPYRYGNRPCRVPTRF